MVESSGDIFFPPETRNIVLETEAKIKMKFAGLKKKKNLKDAKMCCYVETQVGMLYNINKQNVFIC